MAVDAKMPPLVILGLDVGDPDAIEDWARRGYLPTIASTMRRGCWGRTGGPELVCEHGIWVSMFSGISRSQHGYYYFRQLKPGTYDLQAVAGPGAGVTPFWSLLSGTGRKVAIVDVPDARPVSGLPGLQLLDLATHYPVSSMTSEPPELLETVRQVFGPLMRIDEKLKAGYREDRQIYLRLLERVKKKGELCRHLLSRGNFDVVVVVFSESHTASHQFWKYRPESEQIHRPPEGNLLGNAIRDVYQAIDCQLGLLLQQLPLDANVFIVSSTGIEDNYPSTGLIEACCRQLGYQASGRDALAAMRPIDILRQLIPETWRAKLSRVLPRSTQERLLSDKYRSGTNWPKTTAFVIPSLYSSFLRINLRGREPEGCVEPGANYEELLVRLEGDLRELVDPRTGRPAVKQVVRACELFGGGPPTGLPDLFVTWEPSKHFRSRLVHPRGILAQRKPDFFRGSDHTQSGFIAAAGPSIRGRGLIGDVSLLDLAPTYLSLLGMPTPRSMSGQGIRTMGCRSVNS